MWQNSAGLFTTNPQFHQIVIKLNTSEMMITNIATLCLLLAMVALPASVALRDGEAGDQTKSDHRV